MQPQPQKTMKLAIMQGRLLPKRDGRFQCFPRDAWSEEIRLAGEVQLDGIEWIYDGYSVGGNPLETDDGVKAMREQAVGARIAVSSLCADYFMDFPLVRCDETQWCERVSRLCWLIGRCATVGIRRIVIPFVDISRIETPQDEDRVVDSVCKGLPVAEAQGVELHLETALPPDKFATLLSRMEHPLVKVNYDSGNSASLGFASRDEFEAYGARIGSVHIKDRLRNGGTVPLGTGSVDFASLRECLLGIRHSGEFVLQVARGQEGKELDWARQNRKFVTDWWMGDSQPAATSVRNQLCQPNCPS